MVIKLNLDRVMENLGISRYELAKKTNISYQIVDNYYKNKVKRYDRAVLERFCEALECDVSDLLIGIKE